MKSHPREKGHSAEDAAPRRGARPGSAPRPGSASPASRRRPAALLAVLLLVIFAAAWLSHWPALPAKALTFDDNQYLTENKLVNDPGLTSAWRFLSEVLYPSTVQGYYQPLAMISLMADAAMGGSEANLRPFHRTSLLLHALNSVLVVILLYQLFGRAWPAFLVGLLFATHPMTVEPIPWVGERKTLLAAFFALVSLILYVRYARHCSQSSGTRSFLQSPRLALVGCIAAYVLALLSKPTSTMLPVVMLLLDIWPLRRFGRRAILEKIPLYAITVVSSIITIYSQKNTATIAAPGDHYSAARILLTLCHNIVFYPWKMLWPVDLSAHYAYPATMSMSEPALRWGVIGTVLLLLALTVSLRWTRALVTGWLIFFAAIFPTMGVIGFTNVIASDKYAYLPVIGFLITLTWIVTRLWDRFTGRTEAFKGVFVFLAAFIAYVETFQTWGYLDKWQTTESLFLHMLDQTPNAVTLHNNYSAFLIEQGRFAEAESHCRLAVAGRPNDADARLNLAIALVQQGHSEAATEQCRQALGSEPEHVKAHIVMSGLLVKLGKSLRQQKNFDGAARALEEAAAHCQQAIRLAQAPKQAPEQAAAYNYLGLALVQRDDFAKAIEAYRQAVQRAPKALDFRNNLGNALARAGDYVAAVEQFEKIIHDDEDSAASADPLVTGDWAARRRQAEMLKLNARVNMGVTLSRWGKKTEAAHVLRDVLRIAPGHPQATAELRAIEGGRDKSRK